MLGVVDVAHAEQCRQPGGVHERVPEDHTHMCYDSGGGYVGGKGQDNLSWAGQAGYGQGSVVGAMLDCTRSPCTWRLGVMCTLSLDAGVTEWCWAVDMHEANAVGNILAKHRPHII